MSYHLVWSHWIWRWIRCSLLRLPPWRDFRWCHESCETNPTRESNEGSTVRETLQGPVACHVSELRVGIPALQRCKSVKSQPNGWLLFETSQHAIIIHNMVWIIDLTLGNSWRSYNEHIFHDIFHDIPIYHGFWHIRLASATGNWFQAPHVQKSPESEAMHRSLLPQSWIGWQST
jgi:hypothetical protein